MTRLLRISLFSFIINLGFQSSADEIKFLKKAIKLGDQKITVEIADTPELQERGLMFRKKLPDDQGMLFIFEKEAILHFWMKDTLIPLSIGFFDKNKKLFQIKDMTPASPMDMVPKITDSKRLALYALEMPKGWFKKKNIKIGDKLSI